MTRVWLIRHGEPARERGYGSLDVGLSEAERPRMSMAEKCPVEISSALIGFLWAVAP